MSTRPRRPRRAPGQRYRAGGPWPGRSARRPRALKNVHIHIAGIHYGDKGEIKHLNLEGDALMLKKLYQAQEEKRQ